MRTRRDVGSSPALSAHALALAMSMFFLGAEYVRADGEDGKGSPADDKARGVLLTKWAAQQSAVVNGQYKVKLYRYGQYPGAVQRAQFSKGLDSLTPDTFSQWLVELRRDLTPARTQFWGVPIDVFEQGSRQNNRWRGMTAKEVADDVYLRNGADEIQYNSFNQEASIHPGSTGIHVITVADLRYLPAVIPGRGSDQFQIKGRAEGTVTVQQGGTELVADENTGFIRRAVMRNDQGRVHAEAVQVGPRTYPGEIVFPTLSIRANYDNTEKLVLLSVYHLLEVTLNTEIPESTFVMGVPKKTNVVDFRRDRNNPVTLVTTQAVSDVIAFADTAEALKATQQPRLSDQRRLVLVAGLISGTGLIIIGVWLRRRKPRLATG
jgi:hypothetical protein